MNRPGIATITGASIVTAFVVSSCGLAPLLDVSPEADFEEVSEFVMQPGTMSSAEAESFLIGRVAVANGELIPGSAIDVASVTGPGGEVHFLTYQAAGTEDPDETQFCSTTVTETAMFSGCGPQELGEPMGAVMVSGESWGDRWRLADFQVQDTVALVEATAADGSVYTVTPVNGVGYVEWPDERGSIELVAYDADGVELGRAIAGLDQ